MFRFVTDALENHMKRKLLSIAHSRFDHFIASKFKGMLGEKIEKTSVIALNSSKTIFRVNSSRETGTTYIVDMDIGVCSCEKGKNGSPCLHQAAIFVHHKLKSINFVPTLQPSQRQDIAFIALGDEVKKDLNFYSSLHEGANFASSSDKNQDTSDFTGSCWDLVRAGAQDDNDNPSNKKIATEILSPAKKEELHTNIEKLAVTLKSKLESNDPQLIPGIEKFLARFHDMSALPSDGRLASALHTFGTQPKGSISLSSGNRRWGKRIGVQATASGRRKYGSRGKAQVTAGRPRSSFTTKAKELQKNTRYTIPVRKKNQVKKKRPHNLSQNISQGKQNAGKW